MEREEMQSEKEEQSLLILSVAGLFDIHTNVPEKVWGGRMTSTNLMLNSELSAGLSHQWKYFSAIKHMNCWKWSHPSVNHHIQRSLEVSRKPENNILVINPRSGSDSRARFCSCSHMNMDAAEQTVKTNDGGTFSRHYLPRVHLRSSLCEIKRIISEL